MNPLPQHLIPYRQTPEFTALTMPDGLLQAHRTKAGVWSKIITLTGELTYRILDPDLEEISLHPGVYGVVEPTVKHEVVPQPGVRFYIELYQPQA